jgi:trk system potassium uptake protein TrkA
MRIVFSGAGPATVMAARSLIDEGHEVVIIELDEARIEHLSDELDCSFLHGDAAEPNILRQVDPSKCDFLFCLTNSDQANIITALLGRSMGFKRVVTSIENAELESLCRELGLKDIIIPVRTMSHHLDNMVRGLDNIEISTLLKKDARFFAFTAGKEESVTADELELPEDTRIVYYYRDDDFYLADEKTTFKNGDEIVILTRSEHLATLAERWDPKQVDDEN